MISVIIPTYNNGKHILSVLNSFLAQESPPEYELIVVDDGSTDNTQQQLGQINSANVKMIEFKNQRGVTHARNAGIEEARGDKLVFTVGDAIVPKDYLALIEQLLSSTKTDGVVGPCYIDLPHSRDLFVRYLNRARSPAHHKNKALPPEYITFTNCGIQRSLIDQSGMFDISFQGYGGHELELAHRMVKNNNAQFRYSGDIATHRQSYRTFPETRKQFYHFGNHNLPLLLQKLPEYTSLYRMDAFERTPKLTSLGIKVLDGFLRFILPINDNQELGGWLRIKPKFIQFKFIKTALGAALLRGYLDYELDKDHTN